MNNYKILENNTVIEFEDGKQYKIPEYYNREMIAINDKKTIEMVIISINFNPDKYLIKEKE